MSLEIYPNYEQTFLFPPRLEDFVPPDHPARFIREFVESLDLAEMGFSQRTATEGRPNYSSDLLLKIWLYGYLMKIRTSRKLEKACMENLGLLWLTGMIYPDHNSIWRFFKSNRALIKKVFKRSVQLAAEMDLVGMVLNAIDGTKIQADVCNKKSLHRNELKTLLNKIDESIEEQMSQIESNETGDQGKGYKLPEEFTKKLADTRKLKEEISGKLKRLEEEGLDHQSNTDSDARMMKNGKGKEFCFNGQAAVDDRNGIIVASDVVSDESDNHILGNVLDAVEGNVGQTAAENVADGGYFSGEELQSAEKKGREVLIHLTDTSHDTIIDRQNEFHHSNFTYSELTDTYECPKGGTLKFQRIKKNRRKNYTVRVYHCKEYKTCPFRDQCSQNKRGRTIEISPFRGEVERQRKKQNNELNRAILAKRKTIVEPVFGVIKHNWGFRRWTVRGIDNVRAQWNLICTTYNLNKIYRCWALIVR
jgi:transposase